MAETPLSFGKCLSAVGAKLTAVNLSGGALTLIGT